MIEKMNCSKFSSISVLVYVLISIFAISSWVDIVGLWVELPLIINQLPERWNLPSYMALTIQLSNVAPAMYTIISKVRSMKRNDSGLTNSHRKRDIILSILIISIEALSILLMSFFWDKTVWINGKERSIALLSLLGFCALCSCMSSLVYLPYMARYPATYLSAYYIGQGLSGLIPGLTGLVQGLGGEPTCVNSTSYVNEMCETSTISNCSDINMATKLISVYPEPRFSIKVYFIIICLMLLVSLLAFYILNYTKLRKHQCVVYIESRNTLRHTDNGQGTDFTQEIQTPMRENESSKDLINVQPPNNPVIITSTSSSLIFYLTLVALLNAATNGILPSTQSYTCLPYGNVVYTLAIRLSSVVGPIASLSTMFLPKPCGKLLAGLTSLGLSIVIYHLVLAFQSPHPILQHHPSGSIIVVVSTLVMSACFSFVRVSVASVLHGYGGRRALIWCGGVTQVGSFCGAMLAFFLINWTSLFTSVKPCSEFI